MIVFVKCRRYESTCFFRSYVFGDCGHEDKRKLKRNIVCLCGLQWLCLLSVGDLRVNVSKGRMSLRRQEKIEKEYCMSLRTAMIVFVKCRRYDSKCFLRSYVFADCGHEDKRKSKRNIVCLCGLQWLCLLSVGDLKVNVSSGCMSLRTAATKTKRKSKSNIVPLCGLQWLCLLSVGNNSK